MFVLAALLAQPLILYWRPLMEWRTRSMLRRNPNLIIYTGPWTPTTYHRWYADRAKKFTLPVSWYSRWLRNHSPLPVPSTIGGISGDPGTADADLIGIGNVSNLRALVLDATAITDKGLKYIAGLSKLEILRLSRTAITDEGFAHIANLKELTWLRSSMIDVTDAGLVHLEGLTQISKLDLSHTPITDAGLAHIARLPNLSRLDLSHTAITDNGIPDLLNLNKLMWLNVDQTAISEAGCLRLEMKINAVVRFPSRSAIQ